MKYLIAVFLLSAVSGQVDAIRWKCCASDTIGCAACLVGCALCDAATPGGAVVCGSATLGCASQCVKCVGFNAMNGGGTNFSKPIYISPFSSQIALLNKTEIWNKKVGPVKVTETKEPLYTLSGPKEKHFTDIKRNNSTLGFGCVYGASNYCMTKPECIEGCMTYYGTSEWCLYNNQGGTYLTGCCQCDVNCPSCSNNFCPCPMGCGCA